MLLRLWIFRSHRPCDLWHHNVCKRATEPWTSCRHDFVHSSIKENIYCFMEFALSDLYQLLIWWKGAHLRIALAVSFTTLDVECMACMSYFYMINAVSCLPWNALECTRALFVNKGYMVCPSTAWFGVSVYQERLELSVAQWDKGLLRENSRIQIEWLVRMLRML